jgi:hypothetical protein
MALFQLATDPFTNEIDGDLHPGLLASKASQADNPTFEEAMYGPHREGFHEAMVKELKTLEDMNCWEVIDQVPGSNVLPSTWAFQLKRFADGSLSKYKARFCAGGHRQIEGIDFFETFAPVVNWTTVRLLLVLSQVLNLSTKQVDFTVAFMLQSTTLDMSKCQEVSQNQSKFCNCGNHYTGLSIVQGTSLNILNQI